MSQTRLPVHNLDVVRSIAVLCVVVDHVGLLWGPRVGAIELRWLGTFGVYLFFVHTSLVLMASLERLQGDIGSFRHTALTFYVRRAFRIYPLAWVTVAFAVAVRLPSMLPVPGIVVQFVPPTAKTLIGNTLLAQNLMGAEPVLYQLWSLPVEVQMYLFLPVLFLTAKRSPRTLVALLIAGASWTVVQRLIDVGSLPEPHLLWRINILRYTPCFLSGVIGYAILLRQGPMARRRAPAWALFLMTLLAFIALALSSVDSAHASFEWIGCVIVGVSLPWIADFGESWLTRAAKATATYSYGIYMLHPFALWLAFRTLHAWPAALQILVFVVVLATLSFAAYHAVEAPFVRIGQRIRFRPAAAAVPAESAAV